MLYGYGTFEMNLENDPQFATEPTPHVSGVCTGSVRTNNPTLPPWWTAYQRAIIKHRGSQSMWHDASFHRGYEEGLSDANDEIGRLKRRIDELKELADLAKQRLKTIWW